MHADGLIKREEELAEIGAFLDRSRTGLHGLLLWGPAGIGKTALWKAALASARDQGLRVLACRPTEVETALSFSGLIDLLGDVADELLPSLPEPQRHAVEAALLRSRPDPMPAPLGISLGVLSMLRAAAERGPVLLAIDDAPWLDDATARVLEFAVRRLEDAPIGVLAAQRSASARAAIPGAVAAIPAERRSALVLEPLSLDAVASVLEQTLGLVLRRPDLVRVHDLSGGNTLYALEIGRAIQRRGDGMDAEGPPIPDSLDALVRDRIDALPAASRPVTLLAAALSAPTASRIAAVTGEELAADALAAAADAGVLDLDGDSVRFSHPLLAAAILGRATAEERRAAHLALATVVHDVEEQARHLALSTDDPDAIVAEALEAASMRARSRGAGAAAAELAEAAIRLTPADESEARRRRTLVAADHHRDAGDVPRAVAILERLAAETTGPARAPILAALGEKLLHTGDRTAAGVAFEEALALVGDDLGMRVRIESGLAAVAHLTWVNWRDGDRHMTSALHHAEELGDPVLLKQTIGHYATWSFQMGRGIERERIARAQLLPDPHGDVRVINDPDFQLGSILISACEIDEARRIFERLLRVARQRGEWFNLPWVLVRLVRLEIAAGNWQLAETYLDEGRRTAQQSGQDAAEGYLAQVDVHLLALRGNVEGCRTTASHAMRISEEMRLVHRLPTVASALAVLDLSLRDAAAAYRTLEPVLAFDGPGHEEPALLRPALPLAVEALVGLARLDEAEALLAPYEQLARGHDRAVSVADALHCRAVLLSASGASESAEEAANEARSGFTTLGMPFEAGRAALVLAEAHRRGRQRSKAGAAAGEALAAFERLGAARWADRARDELARAEGRRRPGSELTETEQQVVDLVAEGRTNREIAAALFMSVHTVEARLTRIYRALGVRSRTELAGRALGADRSDERQT